MNNTEYITCTECGKKDRLNRSEEIKKEMISRALCFSCNFWNAYANRVHLPISVRVGDKHYMILSETLKAGAFRGFNGRKFRIRFHDGRFVETTNLWCQGKIPERFKSRLADNAEFV